MIDNKEEIVKKITKLILTNQQKMIKEEDMKNLYDRSLDLDFDEIIYEVYEQLKKFGLYLIKNEFQGYKYYVLISEGKDDNITPSQYGTLALIFAISKEVNENINIDDLKEIFEEVWTYDIQFLIKNDYLRIIKDLNIIKVTPLGKALLNNIIQDLNLKNLLDAFKGKEST